jgi:hypothetical protein
MQALRAEVLVIAPQDWDVPKEASRFEIEIRNFRVA